MGDEATSPSFYVFGVSVSGAFGVDVDTLLSYFEDSFTDFPEEPFSSRSFTEELGPPGLQAS